MLDNGLTLPRRKVLASVGLGVTAAAGCTTGEELLSSGSDDPTEVVERFIEAVSDGDSGTIASLSHSNGKFAGEADRLAERGKVDVVSVQTAVAAEGENEAFVDTQLKYRNESGDIKAEDDMYELRTEDGKWRIYEDSVRIPLEYRLEGVAPADSFETAIGLEESSANQFFGAKDVSIVDLRSRSQSGERDMITLTFSEESAERIRATAAELENRLVKATIFEYLGDELSNRLSMSAGLAEAFQSGQWTASPEFILRYEDAGLAERVAATILKRMQG